MLKISTTPHFQTQVNTRQIMLDVIIALLPAALAAVLFFGVNALLVILTSVASCVFFEYAVCRWGLKSANTTHDLSAIITGLLLAYNLPSSIPLGMILAGAFMAIVVAKICYGGLGKNIFNPALVGRVFLFISFPVQMTHWPQPHFLNFFAVDAQTGATTLGLLKHMEPGTIPPEGILPSYEDMFIGNIGGCIGEISALALLLGLIYLLWRGIITWHIPFYYVGTVFILTGILYLLTGDIRYDPLRHILSGGLLLGAFFMATDYATSPMTVRGQVLYAIACGILTVVIRLYGAYPEGVSFAILIMNAFVPLIDKYVHGRIFGHRR